MDGRDVRLKSLSVVRTDGPSLHPIDLEVAGGEIVALLGPAGSGATTLLETVAGFRTPTLGRVLIGGEDVTDLPPGRRPSALIFRELALFPALSVADNVAFGLEARGIAAAARRARADELLGLLGLAGSGDRRPADLDPGEAPLVALARALAIDPAVLLLDDPFAGLAPDRRRTLRRRLRDVRDRTGTTILHHTEDPAEAFALADRIAVIDAGRIAQLAPPDRLYAAPATRFVAGFVGDRNLLPGRVVAHADGRVAVETAVGRLLATPAGPLAVGDTVEVMIRPERLRLETERPDLADPAAGWNRLRGDVVGRTLEGPDVVYDLLVGDTRLTLRRPNLGLRGLLLASFHAVGFEAADALVFPLDPAAERADG